MPRRLDGQGLSRLCQYGRRNLRHAARLPRYDIDPLRAGGRRFLSRGDRDESRTKPCILAAPSGIAYCQGTLLRNEIEAREAGRLDAATDYAASAIADRHGGGEIAAKIQAHVIVAAA
jgi:hypothetical protein